MRHKTMVMDMTMMVDERERERDGDDGSSRWERETMTTTMKTMRGVWVTRAQLMDTKMRAKGDRHDARQW